MIYVPVRQPPVVVAACRGSGHLTFFDSTQISRPHFHLKIPGVARVASIWSQ